MAVFALLSVSHSSAAAAALEERFPGDFLKVGNGQWLVAADLTTQGVATRLGIGEGDAQDSGIVLAVSGYWGRHNPATWEWIELKRKMVATMAS